MTLLAHSVQHDLSAKPNRLLVTAADEAVQETGHGTAAGATGAADGFHVEVSCQQETPAPPAVASSTAVASNTAVGIQPTPTSSQTGTSSQTVRQTSLPLSSLSDSHSPSDSLRPLSFFAALPSRVQEQPPARGQAALVPGQTTSGTLVASSLKEAAPPASTSTALHGSKQGSSAGTTQLAAHQKATVGDMGRPSSQRKAGGLGIQALDRGDSAAEHHMRWAERRRQGGVGADAVGLWAGSGHNKGQQHMTSIREVRVMTLCNGCPACVGAIC